MSTLSDDMRVAAEVRAHLIAAGIDADDADLAALMDGECDLIERLRRILRYARQTEALSKALAEMQAEGRERKSRLDAKADRLRGVVLHAMQELGLKKIEAPDLTASVGAGRAKVVITDEAALPDDVCVMKREPSKTAIAAWLAEKPCPGAELGNPVPVLTVRVR